MHFNFSGRPSEFVKHKLLFSFLLATKNDKRKKRHCLWFTYLLIFIYSFAYLICHAPLDECKETWGFFVFKTLEAASKELVNFKKLEVTFSLLSFDCLKCAMACEERLLLINYLNLIHLSSPTYIIPFKWSCLFRIIDCCHLASKDCEQFKGKWKCALHMCAALASLIKLSTDEAFLLLFLLVVCEAYRTLAQLLLNNK